MIKFAKILLFVYNYLSKNIGLILGVAEDIILAVIQLIKAVGGIVCITPSRKDDKVVNFIEKLFEENVILIFNKIKAILYKVL